MPSTAISAWPRASGSATSSEFVIRFALWAGAVAALLSILLVMVIFLLRTALLIGQRRQRRLLDTWRPRMLASLAFDSEPEPLPVLRPGEVPGFLELWNHLQGSVRGEARERLNRLARQLGLDRIARRCLARSGMRRRLMAISTLGQLGDHEAWEGLRAAALSSHPLLSITAARALLQIDALAAMPLLMPAFVNRSDWPLARVASILREAGPDIVSQPLAAAADGASPEHQARVVSLFDLAHPEVVVPVLRALIGQPDTDDRTLTACLRVLHDPRLLDQVRILADHPRWHIRMEAAKALGRMGSPSDLLRLEQLLTDPQWWVRYRAAQALTRLPFLNRETIEHLRDRQVDRFARDALNHVLAEKGAS